MTTYIDEMLQRRNALVVEQERARSSQMNDGVRRNGQEFSREEQQENLQTLAPAMETSPRRISGDSSDENSDADAQDCVSTTTRLPPCVESKRRSQPRACKALARELHATIVTKARRQQAKVSCTVWRKLTGWCQKRWDNANDGSLELSTGAGGGTLSGTTAAGTEGERGNRIIEYSPGLFGARSSWPSSVATGSAHSCEQEGCWHCRRRSWAENLRSSGDGAFESGDV